MDTQVQEKDAFELPVIDPWRQARRPPSREQIRYATDLCRSELPYAERTRTVGDFPTMSALAMSELIDGLAQARAARLARLRRSRRRAR